MIHSMHRSVIAKKGVTYSYLGYPTTDGEPDSPTSWLGCTAETDDWLIYARLIAASEHSGGTATDINVYIRTVPTADERFVCLYDGTDSLLGSADISSYTTTAQWSGWVSLSEASSGSLDFATTDELNIGHAVKNSSTSNCLGKDSGDTTSATQYDEIVDSGSTPPSSIVLASHAITGLGIILRYIAD